MKLRSAQGTVLLGGTLIVLVVGFDLVTRSQLSATTAVQCEGAYSDSLQLLSLRGRQTEQG
ncbi:MAG TPA: hypothetical protein VGP07_15720, partial [Polyangia bacterium]